MKSAKHDRRDIGRLRRLAAHQLVDELIDSHGELAAVHIINHLSMKRKDWAKLEAVER